MTLPGSGTGYVSSSILIRWNRRLRWAAMRLFVDVPNIAKALFTRFNA